MIRSTLCLAALLASTAQASTSELPTKIVRDLQETNPHAAPKPQCFYSYKMGEDMMVRAGLCLAADPSLEEGSAGTLGLLPACKPGKDEEDNPIPTLHCPDAGYDMLSKMISRDVISGHAFAICSSEDSPALHLGKGSYPEETAWFQAVPLRALMTDDSIVSADAFSFPAPAENSVVFVAVGDEETVLVEMDPTAFGEMKNSVETGFQGTILPKEVYDSVAKMVAATWLADSGANEAATTRLAGADLTNFLQNPEEGVAFSSEDAAKLLPLVPDVVIRGLDANNDLVLEGSTFLLASGDSGEYNMGWMPGDSLVLGSAFLHNKGLVFDASSPLMPKIGVLPGDCSGQDYSENGLVMELTPHGSVYSISMNFDEKVDIDMVLDTGLSGYSIPETTITFAPTATPPFGYGCYDVGIHQCSCLPDECNAELCSAKGMGWVAPPSTRGCGERTRCQEGERCEGKTLADLTSEDMIVPTDAPAEPVPEGQLDPNFGYGCYDVSIHVCGCKEDRCNQEKCEGLGFYWISPEGSDRGCGDRTKCEIDEMMNCGDGTVPAKADDASAEEPASAPITVDEDKPVVPCFGCGPDGWGSEPEAVETTETDTESDSSESIAESSGSRNGAKTAGIVVGSLAVITLFAACGF